MVAHRKRVGYGWLSMAWFKRQSSDPDEMQLLRAEIAALKKRISQTDARARHVQALATPEPGRDVDSLVSRIDSMSNRLDGVDNLAGRVKSMSTRLDGIDGMYARLEALSVRLDEVDARMTAVSNELAAQIDEVGRDGAPVEQLREAQVRLANEQARYQIQFNQDLAELADRLRGDNGQRSAPPDNAPDSPTG